MTVAPLLADAPCMIVRLQKLFDLADRDGDGKITYAEMCRSRTHQPQLLRLICDCAITIDRTGECACMSGAGRHAVLLSANPKATPEVLQRVVRSGSTTQKYRRVALGAVRSLRRRPMRTRARMDTSTRGRAHTSVPTHIALNARRRTHTPPNAHGGANRQEQSSDGTVRVDCGMDCGRNGLCDWISAV